MVRQLIIDYGKQQTIARLDLPILLMKFQNAIDLGFQCKNDDGTNAQLLEYLISDLEVTELNRTQWSGVADEELDILANCLDTLQETAISQLDCSVQAAVDKHLGGTIREHSIATLCKNVARHADPEFIHHASTFLKLITINATARDRGMREKFVDMRARCKELLSAKAEKSRSKASKAV
jgi:hypothetical protein